MINEDDMGYLVTFRGTAVEHFKVPTGASEDSIKEAIPEYFPVLSPSSEVEFEWDVSEDVGQVEWYFNKAESSVVRRSEITIEFEITPSNEEDFRKILKDTGDVDEDDLESAEIPELKLKVFFEFCVGNAANDNLPEGYEFVDQDEFRDSEVFFGEIVL